MPFFLFASFLFVLCLGLSVWLLAFPLSRARGLRGVCGLLCLCSFLVLVSASSFFGSSVVRSTASHDFSRLAASAYLVIPQPFCPAQAEASFSSPFP